MDGPVVAGQAVPVLAATQGRLNWRALASWIQAVGATIAALIVTASQYQTTLIPLIPVQYAGVGASIFALGKIIEAVQKQKDVTRDKPLVNFTKPRDGNQGQQ
jgi:hypothetical protein